MKTYILTITGAAVLSSFASVLTPEKWRKYTGIITGLVIISCVAAPLAKLSKTDLFSGFEAIENEEEYSRSLQTEIVKEELEKRIGNDIETRLNTEFGITVSAGVSVVINENNEITGIEKIVISGKRLTKTASARLCEIYGRSEDKIRYE